MSGDHLETVRSLLEPGTNVLTRYEQTALRALLDELKQLRAELEQSEAQVRTELSMSIEYRAERQTAYALIAKLRPDERFAFHVRQLLDVDGRGLRDASETVAAVRALLKARDDDYATASAAPQQPAPDGGGAP